MILVPDIVQICHLENFRAKNIKPINEQPKVTQHAKK